MPQLAVASGDPLLGSVVKATHTNSVFVVGTSLASCPVCRDHLNKGALTRHDRHGHVADHDFLLDSTSGRHGRQTDPELVLQRISV